MKKLNRKFGCRALLEQILMNTTNTAETLRQQEIIRRLALEILRTWGFHLELDQLFTHKNSCSQIVEDLEDAVLNAYAQLCEEFQRGKIQAICQETIRSALLKALRRRGLDRKPFTAHRLLKGIATSKRQETRRRYLQWAKHELQGELKRRFREDLPFPSPHDSASLEGVVDYFLAEFVPQAYTQLNTHENGGKSLLDRCYEAFFLSKSELRRAQEYTPWITPVSPRLAFQSADRVDLERRSGKAFERQPEYEELIVRERLRAQVQLLRGKPPDNDLWVYLQGDLDPAERRRLELCLIFSQLLQESKRKPSNLKAYMIYVFSHFPAPARVEPPKRIPLERVTLDQIQGCELSWEEVCRRFSGGPKPGDYTTKRRIEQDMVETARALGFIRDATTPKGARHV